MESAKIVLVSLPGPVPALNNWAAAVAAGILTSRGFDTVRSQIDCSPFEKNQDKIDFADLDPASFLKWKKGVHKQEDSMSDRSLQDLVPGMEHLFSEDQPGIFILFLLSAKMLGPADALAENIKNRFPQTPVLVFSDEKVCFNGGKAIDKVVFRKNYQGLKEEDIEGLISSVYSFLGMDIPGPLHSNIAVPDFLEFAGDGKESALKPDNLLPVQPLYFEDSDQLSDFLQAKAALPGVRGFIFDSTAFWTQLSPGKGGKAVRGIKQVTDRLDKWFKQKSPDLYFGICLPLAWAGREAEAFRQINWAGLFDSGLRLLQWEAGEGDEIPVSLLWGMSKLGIWNHLKGSNIFAGEGKQGLVIANNPHIVHSFFNELPKDSDQGSGKGLDKKIQNNSKYPSWNDPLSFWIPEELVAYGRVTPLPGIPYWQILESPEWILVFLIRMSRKKLGNLRADPNREVVFSLGSDLEFYYLPPEHLPPGVMDEICRMVDAGGSVDITHVRANLERAFLLGYAVESSVIVGNSSLKRPRQVFIDRLYRITGLDFTRFVERGYTSVRPEYRSMGVGAQLLEGLTARAGENKVFSIISEDNLATQKIATRNNTRKILTYFSEKLGKKMGVWMPEHMIDPSWDIRKLDENKRSEDK